ncbi:MAG: hypothetical protein V1827_01815 [Candidatus Micrarchaeota archaeon]
MDIPQPTLILIIMVALLIAVFVVLPNLPGRYDSLARCLDEKGAKMYGTFWCTHCKAQKELFGSSWQFAPYVECSTPDGTGQMQVCRDAGITGYPTWEFPDGSRTSGVVPLGELGSRTGCLAS